MNWSEYPSIFIISLFLVFQIQLLNCLTVFKIRSLNRNLEKLPQNPGKIRNATLVDLTDFSAFSRAFVQLHNKLISLSAYWYSFLPFEYLLGDILMELNKAINKNHMSSNTCECNMVLIITCVMGGGGCKELNAYCIQCIILFLMTSPKEFPAGKAFPRVSYNMHS